jgi:opacity protein-like surface antigen
MKQTAKLAMLAIALFAGTNGTALANGTDRPKAEAAPYVPSAPETTMKSSAPVAESMSNAGPYVSGGAGVAISGEDGIDTGYLIGGAIGYNFDPVRVEGAVGYQRHGLTDFDAHVYYWTFMANAYYDFEEMSGVRPYLMGGLGAADGHWSLSNDSSTDFAWQIGAGIGVKIADNTMFDLGYRYFKPDDGDVSFRSHNILAGIRYQF